MARGYFTLSTLELLAVASLLGQQRFGPLHSHLRGAIRAGCSGAHLHAVIDHLATWATHATVIRTRELAHRELARATAKPTGQATPATSDSGDNRPGDL